VHFVVPSLLILKTSLYTDCNNVFLLVTSAQTHLRKQLGPAVCFVLLQATTQVVVLALPASRKTTAGSRSSLLKQAQQVCNLSRFNALHVVVREDRALACLLSSSRLTAA